MYPHLLEMIMWIAVEYDFTMKGEDPVYFDDRKNWPTDSDLVGGLEFLEWQARRLKPVDRELMATQVLTRGEFDEKIEEIVKKHHCGELQEFLLEVFEGRYHDYFFLPQ